MVLLSANNSAHLCDVALACACAGSVTSLTSDFDDGLVLDHLRPEEREELSEYVHAFHRIQEATGSTS